MFFGFLFIYLCYRSLPNWTNLQIEDNTEEKTHEFEESPEEIRFRNKEESELLIRNLSCKDSISTCEIISDHNKLNNLALMHESMVSLILFIFLADLNCKCSNEIMRDSYCVSWKLF